MALSDAASCGNIPISRIGRSSTTRHDSCKLEPICFAAYSVFEPCLLPGGNTTRKPLDASAARDRSAAGTELSGRGALAAATARSACVLIDGWPVVRVHLSFALARHTGHRTDSICFSVSWSVFTPTVFNISAFRSGHFCSSALWFELHNGTTCCHVTMCLQMNAFSVWRQIAIALTELVRPPGFGYKPRAFTCSSVS